MVPADRGDHLLAHAVGRPEAEFLADMAEHVDRARLRHRQLDGFRHDRPQHRLEVEGRVHGMADLAEGAQAPRRSAQARSCAPGPPRTAGHFRSR